MIDDLLRPVGPGPRPPVDGFALALRAARRRRWRTLKTNAACAATALATVVAAFGPRLAPSSVTGLEPTNPVRPSYERARPTPTPTPTPTVAPDRGYDSRPPGAAGERPGYVGYGASGGPARPGATGGGAGNEAGGGPGGRPGAAPATRDPAPPTAYHPEPSDEPAPEPTEDPTQPPAEEPTQAPPSPTPSPSPTPEPVDQSYEDQSATAPCETSAWCLSAGTARLADGAWALKLRACRPASDASGKIRFDYENEADFRVLRNGAEVWRWSVGEPDDRYAHEVFVDRWQCAVWTTRWWRVDQDGDRVPNGEYRLDATSRASNLPNAWFGTTFTVG